MRFVSLVSDLEGASLLAHHASEDVSSEEGGSDHVADSRGALLVLHAFSTILTLVERSRDAFPGSHAFGSSDDSFAVGGSRLVEVGTSDHDGFTAHKDDRLDHESESLGLLFPGTHMLLHEFGMSGHSASKSVSSGVSAVSSGVLGMSSGMSSVSSSTSDVVLAGVLVSVSGMSSGMSGVSLSGGLVFSGTSEVLHRSSVESLGSGVLAGFAEFMRMSHEFVSSSNMSFVRSHVADSSFLVSVASSFVGMGTSGVLATMSVVFDDLPCLADRFA